MSFVTAENINSFGLALDIAGVWMLFKFGLPADVRRGGEIFRKLEAVDETVKAKARFYDRMGSVALALLTFGFILQIVSNYL